MPLAVNDYYKKTPISSQEEPNYIQLCSDICYADGNCTSFYSITPEDNSYLRTCYFMNQSSQTQRMMENEGFGYFECRLD